MKRRELLRLAAAAPLLGLPLDSVAWMSCGPFTINGGRYCYAGIRSSLPHVNAAAIDGRHTARWCWAACTEMLFGYHGHAIDQVRIVTEAWGSIGAIPPGPEQVVAGLDGRWTDNAGRGFRVSAELLPVSPPSAAAVLGRDAPLVLLTPTHPVVLTRLRYVAMGIDSALIQTADVHDPWPGRAPRRLSRPEWRDAPYLVDLQIA